MGRYYDDKWREWVPCYRTVINERNHEKSVLSLGVREKKGQLGLPHHLYPVNGYFNSVFPNTRYIEVFKSNNEEAMRGREKTMNAVTGGNRGGRGGGFGGGFGGGYGGGFGSGTVRHVDICSLSLAILL